MGPGRVSVHRSRWCDPVYFWFYPTPRIALSVRWFVRNEIWPYFQWEEQQHEDMHHTYIKLSGDVELNPIPTCLHHGYMHHVYMHHVYTHHVYMHHGYMYYIMYLWLHQPVHLCLLECVYFCLYVPVYLCFFPILLFYDIVYVSFCLFWCLVLLK